MKLLLDENISPRAVAALQELYPGTVHVRDVDLDSASDEDLWSFAAERGFVIVSKDSDFHQLSFVRGFPPKVAWVRLGNCTTDEIVSVLLARHAVMERFAADPEAAFLELS